jgi:hypothetical protein
MDAHLDGLFDELVAAEPQERWNDVLHRARRSRRRYAAVVAAIAVFVLAPATWAAVNAFEGTPAPQVIQEKFIHWAEINPRTGFMTHVPTAEASKAHGVLQLQTGDGPVDLWAAPSNEGGTCWFVVWQSDLAADNDRGYGSCAPAAAPSSNLYVGTNQAHPGYHVLSGYAYGDAATVDVTLADGRTATLPAVEGLFMGAFENDAIVASVVARDASGNVVGSSTRG